MEIYVQFIVIFNFLPNLLVIAARECIPRLYNASSIVCVCNETYCDTIPPVQKLPSTEYVVYTTNNAGLRFYRNVTSFSSFQSLDSPTTVTINISETYQSIIGWGGSFTDSVGINVMSLSYGAQENLLRSLYAKTGNEYNMGRVPMAASDFSTHAYSYDDGPVDKDLINFRLAPEDYLYKIPLLQRASILSNDKLQLIASVWTAPKWMKTNGQYAGGGLKPSMYQSWARYFFKFLKCYKFHGINFWGITTGNEPFDNNIPIHLILNDVPWTPSNQSYWIRNNLGPVLKNSEFSNVDILMLDDARTYLWNVSNILLSNDETNKYISGIAVHWYADALISTLALDMTHNKYPNKYILNTESSFPGGGVVLGSWLRAEIYAADIIQDLRNWVTGWVEWNLALNLQGGPTYIHNYLDASIIVNATANEFYKQPTFYALGHFSKFVPKDSVRIAVWQSDYKLLKSTAFVRPDGGVVVTILNSNDIEVPLVITGTKQKNISQRLTPKSINTILYWPN